jgi:hypothetical protein
MNLTIILIMVSHTIISKCPSKAIVDWHKSAFKLHEDTKRYYSNDLAKVDELSNKDYSVFEYKPMFSHSDLIRRLGQRPLTVTYLIQVQTLAALGVKSEEKFLQKCDSLKTEIIRVDEEETREITQEIIHNRRRFESSLRLLNAITDASDSQKDLKPTTECFAPNGAVLYVRRSNDRRPSTEVEKIIHSGNFAQRMEIYSSIVSQVYLLNHYDVFLNDFDSRKLNIKDKKIVLDFDPFEDAEFRAADFEPKNFKAVLDLISAFEMRKYSSKSNQGESNEEFTSKYSLQILRSKDKAYADKRLAYDALDRQLDYSLAGSLESLEKFQKVCLEFWVIKELARKKFDSEVKYSDSWNKKIKETLDAGVCGLKGRLLI